MTARRLLPLGFLALAFGCTHAPTARAELSGEFPLRFHHSAQVGSDRVTLRFADLVEESRCPRSVVCIWAGLATIALDLTVDGESARIRLRTPGDAEVGAEATALGRRIRLIDLLPYPVAPGRPDTSRYVAQLVVDVP